MNYFRDLTKDIQKVLGQGKYLRSHGELFLVGNVFNPQTIWTARTIERLIQNIHGVGFIDQRQELGLFIANS